MVLEVTFILIATIFVLTILRTKGNLNFHVTVEHKYIYPEAPSQTPVSLEQELNKQLSEVEKKFYDESQSLIGALNQIVSGTYEKGD